MISKPYPPIADIPKDRLVFAAANFHARSLGSPPAIVARPGDMTYSGFFESAIGEQFTILIDRESKTGVLRSGDTGWENAITINNNSIQSDVILASEEYSWLAACWLAATNQILVYPAALTIMNIMKGIQDGD